MEEKVTKVKLFRKSKSFLNISKGQTVVLFPCGFRMVQEGIKSDFYPNKLLHDFETYLREMKRPENRNLWEVNNKIIIKFYWLKYCFEFHYYRTIKPEERESAIIKHIEKNERKR